MQESGLKKDETVSSPSGRLEGAGFVTLAGAGPGDEELITLKLQRRLATAQVIITDRLVNPAIIKNNAAATAQIILAGKQGYNDNSYTQEEVTALLIKYAKEGKNVLRLKGGDVAFFSNVLDELEALKAHHISYEIIPGITAASGASAYSGIPLTARGYAQGVQFIALNPNQYFSTEQWKHIAQSNDTLVFYMAVKNILSLAEMLLRYSKNPGTGIAVIEQATTPHQQVHITTLKKVAIDFAGKEFSSPSLIIVGDVVGLYKKYNWNLPDAIGTVFSALVK
ncbi:MAG: uroporphyrinogen-III C-methyltransferase [Bacteroidota bacterium]|jgi:uroporphyrin-III C-methyltransferase